MKRIKNHQLMDNRTVKAWLTSRGTFIQIYDTRDIDHGCYNVEVNTHPGGMESVYANWSLDSCEMWVSKFGDRY